MTTYRDFILAQHDRSPEEKAANAAERALHSALGRLEHDIDRLEQGIVWRTRHGKAHLLPKWERELAEAREEYESVKAEHTRLAEQAGRLFDERRERTRRVQQAVVDSAIEGVLEDEFAREGNPLGLFIDYRGGSNVEVHITDPDDPEYVFHAEDCPEWPSRTSGQDRPLHDECVPIRRPRARFGYDATVYLPDVDYFIDDDMKRRVKEPTINWGTIGTLRLDDAEIMAEVHRVAIRLGWYISGSLDSELPEELLEVAA